MLSTENVFELHFIMNNICHVDSNQKVYYTYQNVYCIGFCCTEYRNPEKQLTGTAILYRYSGSMNTEYPIKI